MNDLTHVFWEEKRMIFGTVLLLFGHENLLERTQGTFHCSCCSGFNQKVRKIKRVNIS